MKLGTLHILCSVGILLIGLYAQERIVIGDGRVKVQQVSMWGREVVTTVDMGLTELTGVDVSSETMVAPRRGLLVKHRIRLTFAGQKAHILDVFGSTSRDKVNAMKERIEKGIENGSFYEAHFCRRILFVVAAVTFLLGLCFYRGILTIGRPIKKH